MKNHPWTSANMHERLDLYSPYRGSYYQQRLLSHNLGQYFKDNRQKKQAKATPTSNTKKTLQNVCNVIPLPTLDPKGHGRRKKISTLVQRVQLKSAKAQQNNKDNFDFRQYNRNPDYCRGYAPMLCVGKKLLRRPLPPDRCLSPQPEQTTDAEKGTIFNSFRTHSYTTLEDANPHTPKSVYATTYPLLMDQIPKSLKPQEDDVDDDPYRYMSYHPNISLTFFQNIDLTRDLSYDDIFLPDPEPEMDCNSSCEESDGNDYTDIDLL